MDVNMVEGEDKAQQPASVGEQVKTSIEPPSPPPIQDQQKSEDQSPPAKEFFIKLKDPIRLRRDVLESSKSTLGVLKSVYKLQEMREKKKEAIAIMRREIKELKQLVDKLDELMPQYSKADIKKYFPHIDLDRKDKRIRRLGPVQSQPKQPVEKQEELSQMDLLEQALAKVEQKISNLPKDTPVRQDKNQDLGDLGKSLSELKRKLGRI